MRVLPVLFGVAAAVAVSVPCAAYPTPLPWATAASPSLAPVTPHGWSGHAAATSLGTATCGTLVYAVKAANGTVTVVVSRALEPGHEASAKLNADGSFSTKFWVHTNQDDYQWSAHGTIAGDGGTLNVDVDTCAWDNIQLKT